jgi:hypothetical protein
MARIRQSRPDSSTYKTVKMAHINQSARIRQSMWHIYDNQDQILGVGGACDAARCASCSAALAAPASAASLGGVANAQIRYKSVVKAGSWYKIKTLPYRTGFKRGPVWVMLAARRTWRASCSAALAASASAASLSLWTRFWGRYVTNFLPH